MRPKSDIDDPVLHEKCGEYARLMTTLTGKDILQRRRDADLAYARFIVMWTLYWKDGYTHAQISHAMGMKPSIIWHAKKKVSEMLAEPKFYPKETELLTKFKEKINDIH